MEINKRQRRRLRVQDGIFVLLLVLIVGLLGWLGQRYSLQFDLTASGRNSLSQASRDLLDQMPGEVSIDAYARELEFSPTRRQINHEPAVQAALKFMACTSSIRTATRSRCVTRASAWKGKWWCTTMAAAST